MAGTKTSTGKTLLIPALKKGQMIVTIKGDTPLIVHRFGDLAIEKIEAKQGNEAKVAPGPRNPEAEFRDALHVIDAQEERYGFPSSGIKEALVSAGYRVADETGSVLRAVLFIHGELLEIKGSKPIMRRDTVRINRGLSGDLRYRPQFWPWEIDVLVTYIENKISADQVINLFGLAGLSIGLGDWRPEKKGWAGTFSIKEASILA